MSIALITPPAVEPVSLAEAKLQCGLSPIEDSDHIKEQQNADLLRRYIRTARQVVENKTRRALITQTWLITRDGWPGLDHSHGHHRDWPSYARFWVPKPPFIALLSFVYVDTAGCFQNMVAAQTGGQQPSSGNAGDYTAPVWGCQISPGSETQPAFITPPWALPFPPLRLVPNNVQLVVECGYGATGDTVPSVLRDAILFLVHSYFDPTALKDVDKLTDNLIEPYVNGIA